eukprot:391200-Pyramimonas_sp.AAC.1
MTSRRVASRPVTRVSPSRTRPIGPFGEYSPCGLVPLVELWNIPRTRHRLLAASLSCERRDGSCVAFLSLPRTSKDGRYVPAHLLREDHVRHDHSGAFPERRHCHREHATRGLHQPEPAENGTSPKNIRQRHHRPTPYMTDRLQAMPQTPLRRVLTPLKLRSMPQTPKGRVLTPLRLRSMPKTPPRLL